jgi:hypothetical protein
MPGTTSKKGEKCIFLASLHLHRCRQEESSSFFLKTEPQKELSLKGRLRYTGQFKLIYPRMKKINNTHGKK